MSQQKNSMNKIEDSNKMAMRNYMQDLMRAQKVSEVCIVHDASFSALPDEDLLGSSSSLSDDYSQEFSGPFYTGPTITSSPGNLLGFRERQRRLKEMLSPVKVCKSSPQETMISQRPSALSFSSSSISGGRNASHGRVDSLRSRLTRLASNSSLLDGPPGLTDVM